MHRKKWRDRLLTRLKSGEWTRNELTRQGKQIPVRNAGGTMNRTIEAKHWQVFGFVRNGLFSSLNKDFLSASGTGLVSEQSFVTC